MPKIEIEIEDVSIREPYLHFDAFKMPDGRTFEESWEFNDIAAIIHLLEAEQLFVAMGNTGYKRTELEALCNDIFAWGCSDAEPVPAYELEDLYNMWVQNKRWGVAKWCCIHRNQKPQGPVERDMKKDGVWDDVMENLPDNQGLDGWVENASANA